MNISNRLRHGNVPRCSAGFGGYIIFAVASIAAAALCAGTIVSAQNAPSPTGSDILIGHWTYRSFVNRAEHVDNMNDLLFADVELVFEKVAFGQIKGTLNMGSAGSLSLSGAAAYGNPFSLRFQGVGKAQGSPSEGWVYDYIGWYVPAWPNGIDQKPVVVGSVIRTVAHSNGQAKAGVVASFIAVKRD